MLAHTTRALQLLLQAIREVDTLEELERLRATAAELYAADAETLGELTRAIEARGVVLRTQLRLFPTPPVEPPDAVKGPADPDLVREWCEQVHQMGPDETGCNRTTHPRALGAGVVARAPRRDRTPAAPTRVVARGA